MKSSNLILRLCLWACVLTVINACKKNTPPVAIPLPPSITAINPSAGPVNTAVTITGSNFDAVAANNSVKFNGVTATINSVTPTTIVALAPGGASSGPVTVTTTVGTATGPKFTYASLPVITSISPVSGYAGLPLTITGSNFDAVAANNIVKFNGVAAPVTSATGTSIVTSVPPSGTTGNITVTTSGGTSNGILFTYVAAPSASVYVVGRTSSGPAYWKNGVKTDMPADCLEANAIAVDGTDIYIAGAGTNGPRYWKNGAGADLPMSAGHNDGRAKSIFVTGTDVYIAGYDFTNGAYSLPRCWKNGVALPVSLSTGNINPGKPAALGVAYSIYVSGTDVYLAGSQAPSTGNQVVTYWKNGTPSILTDGSTVAEAKSVFVVGSDVYVTGFIQGSETTAYYWKNGNPVPLSINTTSSNCTPEAIYVSAAGDVYVSGEVRNLAKYWKNGVMNDLTSTTPGNSISEPAFALTGYGADIYIAGTSSGQGVGYWKNGAFTALPAAQFLYGIVVK